MGNMEPTHNAVIQQQETSTAIGTSDQAVRWASVGSWLQAISHGLCRGLTALATCSTEGQFIVAVLRNWRIELSNKTSLSFLVVFVHGPSIHGALLGKRPQGVTHTSPESESKGNSGKKRTLQ